MFSKKWDIGSLKWKNVSYKIEEIFSNYNGTNKGIITLELGRGIWDILDKTLKRNEGIKMINRCRWMTFLFHGVIGIFKLYIHIYLTKNYLKVI
jgi:hypothetical protein